MRAFLFILLLSALGSCGKKSNEINSNNDTKGLNGYNGVSAFVSEMALTIPHPESGSNFRSKLLNKLVEGTYPPLEENSKNIIYIHDELQNAELTEAELKDYEIKEKILTKVIVSFSDREEVYFVQEKILAQNLISTLRLKSEENRKFVIVSNPFTETFFGLTFHVVSVNHEDLMLNDQSFYNVDFPINNFHEKNKIENYKKYLIKVGYDFKIQVLSPVAYVAPKVRCTKDMKEADMCGSGCNFTTDLPANDYKKANPKNLQDIGLVLKLGVKEIKLDQLPLDNFKENSFIIYLDSIKNINEEETFEFLKAPDPLYTGISPHYGFGSGCNSIDKAAVSAHSLRTQTNFSLKMTVFGRGEELTKINL